MAKFDEFGREIPDNTPVEMPLGLRMPKPLQELIKDIVRHQMSQEAAEEGRETFDEANDFDVEDDEIPASPYEIDEDEEFRSAEQKVLDRAAKDIDNERAVNNDRVNKESNRGGRKESVSGAERSGVEDGDSGVGDDGKERAKVGGEGRSTGKRGGGVPEGRDAD